MFHLRSFQRYKPLIPQRYFSIRSSVNLNTAVNIESVIKSGKVWEGTYQGHTKCIVKKSGINGVITTLIAQKHGIGVNVIGAYPYCEESNWMLVTEKLDGDLKDFFGIYGDHYVEDLLKLIKDIDHKSTGILSFDDNHLQNYVYKLTDQTLCPFENIDGEPNIKVYRIDLEGCYLSPTTNEVASTLSYEIARLFR